MARLASATVSAQGVRRASSRRGPARREVSGVRSVAMDATKGRDDN